MRAGALRQRVTFQTATITQNSVGEPVNSWADIDTVWARVEPLAGKERFAAMHQQADVDYRITCRYQSGLSSLAPDDRVVWGTRVFDIKSVFNTEERRRELQVFVKRHLNPVEVYSEGATNYVVNSGTFVLNSGTQVVHTP